MARSTAPSFITGSVPGKARSTGQDWVLGAAPNWVDAPEKIFDWVDSCTAIVEHHDGRLELIEWGKREAVPIDADLVATLQSLATLQPRAGATATEHRASRDSPSRSA